MSGSARPDRAFYRGKRVLVTGHTGFKGSWLVQWLHRLGARVTGVGLEPETTPDLFSLAGVDRCCEHHVCDIRDREALTAVIRAAEPQIVLHLAAQPLVRRSYREPVETLATNVMGTAHVLEALRGQTGARVAVMITTDKVYREREGTRPYREDDALGGHDPYSASKAAGEIVIAGYRGSFLADQGLAVASARAGNVIGGGDWSEDRIIPDAVRAWRSGRPLQVRRPDAVRPWQHVLDTLAGYLVLTERLWRQPDLAAGYNFGPRTGETTTVREVVELARECYGRGEVRWGDGSDGPHESAQLTLDPSATARTLGFENRWGLIRAVEETMSWYRALSEGDDAARLCEGQIDAYETTP